VGEDIVVRDSSARLWRQRVAEAGIAPLAGRNSVDSKYSIYLYFGALSRALWQMPYTMIDLRRVRVTGVPQFLAERAGRHEQNLALRAQGAVSPLL